MRRKLEDYRADELETELEYHIRKANAILDEQRRRRKAIQGRIDRLEEATPPSGSASP
jgi:hypothetical protein